MLGAALAGAAFGTLSNAAPQRLAIPAHDGWVTDLADLVSSEKEAQLEALMESYRRGSGVDVAVLTVPSLGGDPIEEFALRVARQWKLGSTERHEGLLLVVAKLDRKFRIEVGRGLEGNVTDAIAGRILRDVLRPRFQAGRFDDGIEEAVRALHAAAGGDYAALDRASDDSSAPLQVLLTLGLVGLAAWIAVQRRSGRDLRGAGRRRGGGFPYVFFPWDAGRGGGFGGFGGGGGGGFSGFGGGGGFSGGGASGGW